MKMYISDRDWNCYRSRAYAADKYVKLGNMKKEFKRAYKLMQRMLEEEDTRRLTASMVALSKFFQWVYDRTGIMATPNNFLIIQKDSTEEDV